MGVLTKKQREAILVELLKKYRTLPDIESILLTKYGQERFENKYDEILLDFARKKNLKVLEVIEKELAEYKGEVEFKIHEEKKPKPSRKRAVIVIFVILIVGLFGIYYIQKPAIPTPKPVDLSRQITEVIVLANSIDEDLAGKDLKKTFKEYNIPFQFVEAEDFAKYKTADKVIILGGHEAYDGVGDIVNKILADNYLDWMKEKIEKESFVALKLSDVYKKGQTLYVFAGNDRYWTKKIPTMKNSGKAFNFVERTIFLAGLKNWEDKIPSKYKNFILELYKKDPAFASYVVAKNLTFEDGEVDSLEENFLKDFLKDFNIKYVNKLEEHYLKELRKEDSDFYKQLMKILEMKVVICSTDLERALERAEALEDIYFYIGNSDAGIKELLELSLEKGIPHDFSYGTPTWNVIVWDLYQLALANEFYSTDSGLPLAIAAANAKHTTRGTSQVQKLNWSENSAMLDEARVIVEWQKIMGDDWTKNLLNEIPIEVQLVWADRGIQQSFYGTNNLTLIDISDEQETLKDFYVNTVSVEGLAKFRAQLLKDRLIDVSIEKTFDNITKIFSTGGGPTTNWNYINYVLIYDYSKDFTDADVGINNYINRKKTRGDCNTATEMILQGVKATGLGSTPAIFVVLNKDIANHVYPYVYFNNRWISHKYERGNLYRTSADNFELGIMTPLLDQSKAWWSRNSSFVIKGLTKDELIDLMISISQSQMKKYIFRYFFMY